MGTDGFTASIDGCLGGVKNGRSGDTGPTRLSMRQRDGAAGLLCRWVFDSLSLITLLLYMQSYNIIYMLLSCFYKRFDPKKISSPHHTR